MSVQFQPGYALTDKTTTIKVLTISGQPTIVFQGNYKTVPGTTIDKAIERRYGVQSSGENHDWNCLNLGNLFLAK